MIDFWFPTIIYYDFLSGIDNKLLSKRAYQMRDESDSNVNTSWECDTWNSLNGNSYFKGDEVDDVIKQLINVTIMHTEKYAVEYGADLENYKIACTDFWFNIAEPLNYQEYHQHNNNNFSAVYYVDTQSNSGDIVFKSMDSVTSSISIPKSSSSEISLLEIDSCSYKPQSSKLLIFKSNLLHMVKKNLSNSDRISIAMNFIMAPK